MNGNLDKNLKKSQEFFHRGETLSYQFRLEQLNRFQRSLEKYEKEILKALKEDLNKSPYEAFMTELGLVYGELSHAKRKLKRWMKPKRVSLSPAQLPGRNRIYSEPYGVALILSPWNYPIQLTFSPLIGSICAGNCSFVKPSAYSSESSRVIKEILEETFRPDYVKAVIGGRKENRELFKLKVDYIFFTGSPQVGRTVMEAAAKNLTPLTLELGGKSPCIVDGTADIKMAAKRILFGKLMNSGQTCIAPDYILVEKKVKDQLISRLIETCEEMVGDEDYFRREVPFIINEKHFERLQALLEGQNVIFGGEVSDGEMRGKRQMKLAIVDEPPMNSPLMETEIFGPILPILAWDDPDEMIGRVKRMPKPLALYLFTGSGGKRDKGNLKLRVLKEISFGGGCINDTLLHIASSSMPFGGVAASGMGRYHGKASFDTFSNKKGVLHKSACPDMPFRYYPYKDGSKTLPRFLFRG